MARCKPGHLFLWPRSRRERAIVLAESRIYFPEDAGGNMRSIFVAMAILMALTTTNYAATDAAPERVTLAQLLKDPARYAQRTVRVTGRMDICGRFSCELCPEKIIPDTNEQQCLGLDFYDYQGAEFAIRRAFLFSTLTVDARFDPSCVTGTSDGSPPGAKADANKIESIVVCLDGPASLLDGRAVEVHSRRTSLSVEPGYRAKGALVAASANDDEHMRTALRLADVVAPGSETYPRVMLVAKPYPDANDPELADYGVACFCLTSVCTEWPKEWRPGSTSIIDPYHCYELVKREGEWRSTPYEW